MPRPKRAGAPEPKKRSRTGCWPCKTRKVKCDEARPVCVNCQRQGETCDYSIRLNWEGRGKKKTEGATPAGFGQITFSAGLDSDGHNIAVTSPDRPASSHMNFQVPAEDHPPRVETRGTTGVREVIPNGFDRSPQGISHNSYHSQLNHDSMIDPVLMSSMSPSVTYPTTTFVQPRSDYQHTQSYERHQSLTAGSPTPAPLPAVSKLRQNIPQEDGAASPIESGIRSPSVGTFSNRSATLPTTDSPTSTPPFFANGQEEIDGLGTDVLQYGRPNKRTRYQSSQEIGYPFDSRMPPPNLTSFAPQNVEGQNSTQSINSAGTPLTPASNNSDDGYRPANSRPSPRTRQDSPDLRRLSVSSLLSGPPGIPYQSGTSSSSEQYQDVYQDTNTWGIDRGIKDLDIGKNDDTNAISGSSPAAMREHLDLVLNGDSDLMPIEFGFGMETNNTTFENGGYYDKPVAICIPRALEPLPSKLLENPMNLLYFHHFLNHTAGCLIPHNCSSNPFRTILPRMAVQDDNLLNLLLAYSASHRARLLRQPEPATRIALWVQDIFPNLRKALDNPGEIISNANLATAIMLASLEIISPKAFGVAVPWQKHLDTARQIIAARGGPQGMQTESRRDKVSSFLWSWFAYLDVLGSLSGPANPSSAWILDYEIDGQGEYNIDCILGFTSKCVRILAKIAELARVCDSQRIGSNLTIYPDWKPSDDTVTRAEKLEADLAESRLHPSKPCTHMQSSGEAAYQWDSIEMATTNEAFHWAGLVHLHRRILGKPSTHPDVQNAVREIHGALYKVRRGSSAEACLLFPMFTAGCDTQDMKQRADILERIKGVERFGMTQVHNARTLMERAWETGKPWETLVAGEFFG